MTAAAGAALITAASALSFSSCARGARDERRPTGLRTLAGLLIATLLACAGASLVAVSVSTTTAVVVFAVGGAAVALPVLVQGLRTLLDRPHRPS